MSTALSDSTEVKKVTEAPNGALPAPEPAAAPRFPYVAAPFAVVAASILAARVLRRRHEQPAKPSVYWSFSVATGNHVYFRPTLAPRFSGLLVGGRGRGRGRAQAAPRRLFRRSARA